MRMLTGRGSNPRLTRRLYKAFRGVNRLRHPHSPSRPANYRLNSSSIHPPALPSFGPVSSLVAFQAQAGEWPLEQRPGNNARASRRVSRSQGLPSRISGRLQTSRPLMPLSALCFDGINEAFPGFVRKFVWRTFWRFAPIWPSPCWKHRQTALRVAGLQAIAAVFHVLASGKPSRNYPAAPTKVCARAKMGQDYGFRATLRKFFSCRCPDWTSMKSR